MYNNEPQQADIYTRYQGVVKYHGSKITSKTGATLAFHIKQHLLNRGYKFDTVKVVIAGKSYYHSPKKEVQTSLPFNSQKSTNLGVIY